MTEWETDSASYHRPETTEHLKPVKWQPGIKVRDLVFSKIMLFCLLSVCAIVVVILAAPKVKEAVLTVYAQSERAVQELTGKVILPFVPKFSPEKLLVTGTQFSDVHLLRRFLLEALDSEPHPITLNRVQHLTRSYPWVEDARVQRYHNGEILVTVREHQPIALYGGQDQVFWLVNASGENFVEITPEQLTNFQHLLRLSGFLEPEYLDQILEARRNIPEAFTHLARADRLQFASWKFWYRRAEGGSVYHVYLRANDTADLLQSLENYLTLEKEYALSRRAVRGYDFRALPHIRVDYASDQSTEAVP